MMRWRGHAIYQLEVRNRIRGWGVILVLGLYMLALLSFLLLGVFFLSSGEISKGDDLFLLMLGVQFVLMCAIGPLGSSAGLSMEFERKSIELVLTTLLRPIDIWSGKLASAVALGWVLFSCGLPFIFFCTLIGGVDLWRFLCGYGFLFVVFVSYCSFALWVSCLIGRTMVSLIVVFVVLGVVNGLFPILYQVVYEMPLGNVWFSGARDFLHMIVMVLSPLLFVESWLTGQSPLGPMIVYWSDLVAAAFVFYVGLFVVSGRLTMGLLRYPRG